METLGGIGSMLLKFSWVFVVIAAIAGYKLILRLMGVVIIPEDSVGIVTKKYVIFGTNRAIPNGHIVALNGEAGIQADTLAPGLHFWLWPWQYKLGIQKFINIPPGQIGIVESHDGRPLSAGRVLGRRVDCDSFQDARGFLNNGGERGSQITIIPPGAYRIHTVLFTVTAAKVTEIPDNMVGIVTTKDGQSLATGEIAGHIVAAHNGYQDAQIFIDNGGFRGLQEQVLLAGRWFINPLFATVEVKPMTEVPIANVGVVIAYVGAAGVDVTGETFRHGNLVTRGQKGVWVDPLDPGKYPINLFVNKVEIVPTANVVLNWASGKTESHKLDENLSTITVRSSDGFTFNMDVSVIIHVPRNDAPKVIARFGTMKNLVSQVLEPTIGNYFRNAAQKSDVIDFLRNRSERQAQAQSAIKAALEEYNVNCVDTLIGDITPPVDLMKTLTDRKIAEQQNTTYQTQRLAEETKKELEQARAMAATQATVVAEERKVAIAEFAAQATVKRASGEAKATIEKAKGDAESIHVNAEGTAKANVAQAEGEAKAVMARAEGEAKAAVSIATGQAEARIKNAEAEARSKNLNGEADAHVTQITGQAESEKIRAIGESEAEVTKLKIASMEAGNYAAVQIARSLAENQIALVPQIQAGGGGAGQGGLIDVLIANLIRDGMGKNGESKT